MRFDQARACQLLLPMESCPNCHRVVWLEKEPLLSKGFGWHKKTCWMGGQFPHSSKMMVILLINPWTSTSMGQNLTNFQYYTANLEFPPATRASSGNLVRVDTPQWRCIQINSRFSVFICCRWVLSAKKKGDLEFHRIQASKNAVFGDLSEDLILLIADFGRFPFLGTPTAFAAKPSSQGSEGNSRNWLRGTRKNVAS